MARQVRIATVALRGRGGPSVEANRTQIAALIEEAGAEKPDLICLPETFLEQGVPFMALDEVAETVPGSTTDLVASYARRYGCYIICPLTVRRGDKFMNESVLLDRRGQVVGSYAKIHPVVEGSEFTSLEKGITPGREAKVFETDFGKIGMQICFDIQYPAAWEDLKRQGAEIVFWSSAYDGGRHLSAHAFNQHYYVVSAVKSAYARITDIMGDVLAMTGAHNGVIAQTINLDVALLHYDFSGVQVPAIRRKYGPDVTIKIWHEEGAFTLEANRADLTVAQIMAEFKIETQDDYLARCAKLQDAWREGRTPEDLTPPYHPGVQWS